MEIDARDFVEVLTKVTKKWTKQRKAEERGRSKHCRMYMYSDRVNFTDAAADILENAYQFASGNGEYTVDKRQFYYQAREPFLEETGREITANYFSQTVIVQYMNRNPEKTAHWKITASPRGTLTIPNSGHDVRIPCGTVAIEEHLDDRMDECDPFEVVDQGFDVQWPSLAEGQRYQAVLYIEKEGFEPQLREARIAERFDIAIISCKGQSVVAARMFADHVCRKNGGVPLLVLHDFDKSGFSICQRLTSVSDYAREHDLVKYEFKNEITVIDLGLRLADVHEYNLKSETCRFSGCFPADTSATKAEQEFLRRGRRVEINAFTAPDFIKWLQGKLAYYLKGKRLIPEDAILEKAYRRALVVARMNKAIEDVREEAIEKAEGATIPAAASLRRKLHRQLNDSTDAWDKVLYGIAREEIDNEDDE